MISDEDIKILAYSIWEQEGRPQGRDLEHYLRAKQILEHQEATQSVVAVATPRPPMNELSPSLRLEELPAPPAKKRPRIRGKKT